MQTRHQVLFFMLNEIAEPSFYQNQIIIFLHASPLKGHKVY